MRFKLVEDRKKKVKTKSYYGDVGKGIAIFNSRAIGDGGVGFCGAMGESLLEGIKEVQAQYPKIDEQTFMKLIKLDPTYKPNVDSVGTYGKWILNLFNKGNLKNLGHVTDVLNRFEDSKKQLINKDIGKYKSIEEVESMLNDENSYKETTHRQDVRERQKQRKESDIEKEADKVYEDSKWVVYVPKTYSASCKLGQGTKWCTATTETSDYYDSYSIDGKLYIIINRQNPQEKYQFHFETHSFMDGDDEEINLAQFMGNNDGLSKFFMGVAGTIEDWLSIEALLDLSKNIDLYEYVSNNRLTALNTENRNRIEDEFDVTIMDDEYYDRLIRGNSREVFITYSLQEMMLNTVLYCVADALENAGVDVQSTDINDGQPMIWFSVNPHKVTPQQYWSLLPYTNEDGLLADSDVALAISKLLGYKLKIFDKQYYNDLVSDWLESEIIINRRRINGKK